VSKRAWLAGILLLAAIHAVGIRHFARPIPFMEGTEHHDAYVMVIRIEERIQQGQSPLQWFVGDWPLYNGFYRPLPTMAFELDRVLFGHNLVPYLIFNQLVAFACSLLLVWLVWELFRQPVHAWACGALYAFWQVGGPEYLPVETIGWWVAAVLLARAWLEGRGTWKRWWLVALVTAYAFRELSAEIASADATGMTFSYRVIGWSPGRTATLFSLFGFLCCASYVRFERRKQWGWLALSVGGLVGAFLSYEQSVVLAPVLLACAIVLWLQGERPTWWFHAFAWAVTLVYVGLHEHYLPRDTRYREQAARGAYGAIRDLVRWLFPASDDIRRVWANLSLGPTLFLISLPYVATARIAANVAAWTAGRRLWLPLAFGLLVSTGAYGPLAFQHFLAHYYHFSMGFRAVLAVWLFQLAYDLSVSAVSPLSAGDSQQHAPESRSPLHP
jgi:hypothetical protein